MKLFITFFHKHLSLHVFVHPSIPAEQQFLFNASYRFFFINLIIDSKRVLQTDRSLISIISIFDVSRDIVPENSFNLKIKFYFSLKYFRIFNDPKFLSII